MKRLLGIIVFSWVMVNASHSEIVNLNCKYSGVNEPKFYLGLDFEKSLLVHENGVKRHMFYTDKIIQTAYNAETGPYTHLLITISRLSGSGSGKGFKLTEEEMNKFSKKNIEDIILSKAGNLDDKSLDSERQKIITLSLIEYLNNYKKIMYGTVVPPVSTEFECEKSEKKF